MTGRERRNIIVVADRPTAATATGGYIDIYDLSRTVEDAPQVDVLRRSGQQPVRDERVSASQREGPRLEHHCVGASLNRRLFSRRGD